MIQEKVAVHARYFMEVLATVAGSNGSIPNPDDPGDPDDPFGPFGPGGPIMRDKLAKVMTRKFVRVAVLAHQIETMQGNAENARGIEMAVKQYVDDFCGNRWPKFPIPKPGGDDDPDPGEPRPIDYITAGLEFYLAAKALRGTALQGTFQDAAVQLVEFGLDAG
ncbi:MAG TPA: hypothetical protein VHP83_00240 [Aggregatilineaceae bacterium]|nr:hypothetical protein [Aggregatilineaceae bacterium]